MVEGGGFEPPKLTRQIYSLIPLATRVPLQKEALDSAFEARLCQTNFRRKTDSEDFCGINLFNSVTDVCIQRSVKVPSLVPPPRVELGTY